MEVNLAIMVMATGVLGMCCLYTFGFRESRQSVEDVAGVSFATSYLAPLVQGLSATNMLWSEWCKIGTPVDGDERQRYIADALAPEKGWGDYVTFENAGRSYRVSQSISSVADGAFRDIMSHVPSPYKGSPPAIDSKFCYALVATRCGAKIELAFRSTRRPDFLMAQPVTVVAVHFQGVPNE